MGYKLTGVVLLFKDRKLGNSEFWVNHLVCFAL